MTYNRPETVHHSMSVFSASELCLKPSYSTSQWTTVARYYCYYSHYHYYYCCCCCCNYYYYYRPYYF